MKQTTLYYEPISNRSTEFDEFRTEPIPKNFWHSDPNRTEIWKAIPQTLLVQMSSLAYWKHSRVSGGRVTAASDFKYS